MIQSLKKKLYLLYLETKSNETAVEMKTYEKFFNKRRLWIVVIAHLLGTAILWR